ncbi:alpha/beta hydrolase [Tabrizicola piscis]|uniref:Alpha/beta hydrolase n=1 Tax=Tabrizicola piscis TaxID=2494374 RepID=A0A3S8U3H0_9RHOB|nr:alpha/beta hydrolase [Tabrizicola piscis]AZL58164.1 alpha/beta hydrolase [Tabrizicola piscis]
MSRPEPDADPYRIRSFVPDFDAITAEIAARSKALAARSLIWSGSSYGECARERMDILLPPNLRQGAPIHMFVHGGYWRSGDKADYTCIAAPVLAVGGIAAIVEYDLMPGTRLGTLVGQVRRAAAWLAARAPGLGADPARLTVSGHSAGAHLASYLAATGRSDASLPATPVAGLLLLSGIYDLSGIPESFLKEEARMTEAEAANWSPLTARQQIGPKRIIALGAEETEPFHAQAGRLHRLCRGLGVKTELMVRPGLNHMNVVLDLADPDQPLGQKLANLVQSARLQVALPFPGATRAGVV